MIEMRIIKQPNYDLFAKNGRRNMRYFVQQLAYRGTNVMQGAVPVRTGQLRYTVSYAGMDSSGGTVNLVWQQDPMRAVVGVMTPYARYVQYGTSRMVAQDYLTPVRRNIEQRIAITKRNINWASSHGGSMR